MSYCALLAAMMSDDPAAQYKGTLEIRKLLSKEKDPPVREVLSAAVLPRLITLLATGDEKLQFESAWAITNIASTEVRSPSSANPFTQNTLAA